MGCSLHHTDVLYQAGFQCHLSWLMRFAHQKFSAFQQSAQTEHETILSNFLWTQSRWILRKHEKFPDVDLSVQVSVQDVLARNVVGGIIPWHAQRIRWPCRSTYEHFTERLCFRRFFSTCFSVHPGSGCSDVVLYASIGIVQNRYLHTLDALFDGA